MRPILRFVLRSRTVKLLPVTVTFIAALAPFPETVAQCNTGSCTQTINTSNSTNITVSSGQVVCVVSGGSLTGSLTINPGGTVNLSGGSMTSSNANISGLIVINSGTFNPSNLALNSGGTHHL